MVILADNIQELQTLNVINEIRKEHSEQMLELT